jgi:VWFA-related protein
MASFTIAETPQPASRRTFLAALAAAATAARSLNAQDPVLKPPAGADETTTFSTDVKVVNVLASVRDKQGRIVTNLGKDDFIVTEDTRPQVIKYFSHDTDLPLTLGLLVDTSASQRRVLGQEKSASFRFLDTVLHGKRDLTFVIHFDHDTELLQDLTASRTDLRHALDQLDLPSDSRPQMRGTGGGYPGGGSGGGRRGGAGTTLYDAIYLAANDIMQKQQGRKAIILLTDGVDNGSKTFLNDAIEAAQRADTIAYSILFADEEAYQQPRMGGGGMGHGGRRGGGRPMPAPGASRTDGKKILERISRETGGSFYQVSRKLTIDDIFDRIQDELRSQYSIGYTSDGRPDSTVYRAIKVTTKQSGMKVQAREGYYPR